MGSVSSIYFKLQRRQLSCSPSEYCYQDSWARVGKTRDVIHDGHSAQLDVGVFGGFA